MEGASGWSMNTSASASDRGESDPATALPLCVFGPGGEYRTAWPPGPTFSRAILAHCETIAERVRAAFNRAADGEGLRGGRRRLKRPLSVVPLVAIGPEGLDTLTEGTHGQVSRKNDRRIALFDAPANRDPDHDSGRAATEWLFPDVAGDRRRTRHQQNHRVRARRGVAQERVADAAYEQGSLFGAYALGTAAG